VNLRSRDCERPSEGATRVASWKLGSEHTSNRSNRDRNITGRISWILVDTNVPAPEVNKALTFGVYMRRTRRVIEFVERDLTRGYGDVHWPGMLVPTCGTQWVVVMGIHFDINSRVRFIKSLCFCDVLERPNAWVWRDSRSGSGRY
jgi:hypothetical protein